MKRQWTASEMGRESNRNLTDRQRAARRENAKKALAARMKKYSARREPRLSGTQGGMEGPVSDDLKRRIHEAASVLLESGAREVYLFGSAATGRPLPPSDIDMAVSGLPPAHFFRAMSKAAVALGRPVDLIDLDEDTPFTRYLRSEGELQRVG